MSKGIGKTPEDNIEYTFKYDNGAVYTFVLFGKNPAGEYIMFEVNKHWKTTMRPSRFAQLYKKNCIQEKRLKITSGKPRKKSVKEEKKDENYLCIDEMLKTLSELDDLQKARVEGVLGYSPDALYCQLRSNKVPSERNLRDYKIIIDILSA